MKTTTEMKMIMKMMMAPKIKHPLKIMILS